MIIQIVFGFVGLAVLGGYEEAEIFWCHVSTNTRSDALGEMNPWEPDRQTGPFLIHRCLSLSLNAFTPQKKHKNLCYDVICFSLSSLLQRDLRLCWLHVSRLNISVLSLCFLSKCVPAWLHIQPGFISILVENKTFFSLMNSISVCLLTKKKCDLKLDGSHQKAYFQIIFLLEVMNIISQIIVTAARGKPTSQTQQLRTQT